MAPIGRLLTRHGCAAWVRKSGQAGLSFSTGKRRIEQDGARELERDGHLWGQRAEDCISASRAGVRSPQALLLLRLTSGVLSADAKKLTLTLHDVGRRAGATATVLGSVHPSCDFVDMQGAPHECSAAPAPHAGNTAAAEATNAAAAEADDVDAEAAPKWPSSPWRANRFAQ